MTGPRRWDERDPLAGRGPDPHGLDPHALDPHGLEDETAHVRPYTVTGGRTRPRSDTIPIEALVQALAPARAGLPRECRQILELTACQYLSVAELSAHLRLPVGVVRVLVCDLSADSLVRVHGLSSAESGYTPATMLSVLESVLDGISAL